MNLRLPDDEAAVLRDFAEREGRSMNDVVRDAIAEYVSRRGARLAAAIDLVLDEDAELLDRLAK